MFVNSGDERFLKQLEIIMPMFCFDTAFYADAKWDETKNADF